ncbi:uncharacterized protein EAE98_006254 [Botrytis deweyae]|nr:uncharacterized protein EAE98_006254 [Botrytis deweyae]KAF7926870.1 hypothetical protein EAE98_006254 [Botrytis deweyae]KAF7929142.1 hypothetical protein EAE99_004886 [Botrytis elliptica]
MDALARQDSTAIGEAMGAYMTEKSGDDLEVLFKRYGTGDENKTPFSKSHAKFVHFLPRTPTEGSGGYFPYAALENFIPEAGSGDITDKQNSSASSDTKDGADSPGKYLTIACMLLHPLSRGNTHITNSSPEIPAEIDPKHLSHPLDLEILSRHVRCISKLFPSLVFPQFSNLPEREITDLDAVKEYLKKAAPST